MFFSPRREWILGSVLLASSAWSQPRIEPLPATTLLSGSPLHLSIKGHDPQGQPLTFSATSSDPLVSVKVLTGNRSLRLSVRTFGELRFELFDGRARRATNRIAHLADSGFYDNVLLHRVVDGFVIQGGDPSGTGTGSSGLGRFADKYHVELQHNRTGMLSMAKSSDDTNDSQFFVTEGPQRHLDFNHSIFAFLVRGEAAREAISQVPVDENARPITDVVIESAEIFLDDQNGVLMLKAPEGATGAVDVTVTARNTNGVEARRTFRVDVARDLVNSPPFLADIPELHTPVGAALTYQLVAVDAEGDPAFYLDETSMATNGLPVPVAAPDGIEYSVDFETGLLTITPRAGLTGTHRLSVGTAVDTGAVDYQVVRVVIGQAPTP